VTIIALPYELHPEIPIGGISLEERWGGRYREASTMYSRIEQECENAGLPFNRPARVPNTRRALKTAEWVRRSEPDAFEALDRSLFETHFVDNRPLDDPDVLDELVTAAGADAAAARQAVDEGAMDEALRQSMESAMDANVTGTPAWLLDGRLLIPGAQSRDLYEIWVKRLRERDA
jgi:predicted DsbA family dithiol-disulfide isomerase